MNILRTFSNWATNEINDFWECPYCKKSYRLDQNQIEFSWYVREGDEDDLNGTLIFVSTCWCPECEKPTIYLSEYTKYEFGEYEPTYNGDESLIFQRTIFPTGISKKYPNYIPGPIREDYKEASLIADLSPKASATLARRCL